MSEKAEELAKDLMARYMGRKPKTISLKLSWDDGSPLFKAVLITISNIPFKLEPDVPEKFQGRLRWAERNYNCHKSIAERIKDELDGLKRKLSIDDLQVMWILEGNLKLSGKVEGNTMFIYEVDEEKAIDAFKA